MNQRLTIKQISELAGVSVGTVDRVLHNRGRVSPKALAAVQAVLENQSYEYNLHTSAVAFKKTRKSLHLIISIPSSAKGEYWDIVKSGLDKAFKEYGDISVRSEYRFFDQFNSLSCSEVFQSIAETDCSAVILGTTFIEETRALCNRLDERGVPYVFLDGAVSETHPVGTFMVNQDTCGRLLARLMDGLTPRGKELAILLPKRTGTRISNNSALRLDAFRSFFSGSKSDRTLKEGYFSTENASIIDAEIDSFLQANPLVGGIAVVISAGYLVADALRETGHSGIVVGGFDVTAGNARCVKEGTIDFLINQHPERQGFYAVESLLHFLLYGTPARNKEQPLSIDVVFLENLPPWLEDSEN